MLPHLKSAVVCLLSQATWVRGRSLAMLAPPDRDGDLDQDDGAGAAYVDDDGDGAASPLRSVLTCTASTMTGVLSCCYPYRVHRR